MSRKANQKTDRQTISRFDEIINVGPATSGDFTRIGIATPQGLIGQDPLELFQRLCAVDQIFHDPCVLDVVMATVDYMNGNPPLAWWNFTAERKRQYTADVDALREKFAR